jgi:hypothetical protein
MELKARLWLWIINKRASALTARKTGEPSLQQLYRSLPAGLTTEIPDPIHLFHPYLIERIIQNDVAGHILSSGPQEKENSKWMDCEAVQSLREKYPVYLRVKWTNKRRSGNLCMIVCNPSILRV